MRICPKCGKEIEEGIFCKDCKPIPEIKKKDIHVKYCYICGRMGFRNRWSDPDSLETGLKNIINKVHRLDSKTFKLIIPDFLKNPGIETDFYAELKQGNKTQNLPGHMLITTCPKCSKNSGNYYESTIQIRNPNENILDYLKKYFTEKNKEGMFVSEKKDLKNGFNIKVTDKKKAMILGKKLKEKFGGTLKISPRIYSRDKQTSKDIYRINVLFEAYPFKVGDIIKIENKILKINKTGNIIIGIDLKTGKKTTADIDNNTKTLKKYKTKVTKTYPKIEVLHPKTYQSVETVNQDNSLHIDENVKIIIDDGIYLI